MLCDKELATEILTLEKNLTSLYYTATEEARTEPIHCELKKMMNDALSNEQNTIRLLLKKNWYQIEEVSADKINMVKDKYNKAAQ